MALTVSTRPTRTKPKLKLCCVARAAFSGIESSAQGTYPSSLKGVTPRRFGPRGVGPCVFCVAYDRVMAEARRVFAPAPRKLVAGRRATREETDFIVSSGSRPCPRGISFRLTPRCDKQDRYARPGLITRYSIYFKLRQAVTMLHQTIPGFWRPTALGRTRRWGPGPRLVQWRGAISPSCHFTRMARSLRSLNRPSPPAQSPLIACWPYPPATNCLLPIALCLESSSTAAYTSLYRTRLIPRHWPPCESEPSPPFARQNEWPRDEAAVAQDL